MAKTDSSKNNTKAEKTKAEKTKVVKTDPKVSSESNQANAPFPPDEITSPVIEQIVSKNTPETPTTEVSESTIDSPAEAPMVEVNHPLEAEISSGERNDGHDESLLESPQAPSTEGNFFDFFEIKKADLEPNDVSNPASSHTPEPQASSLTPESVEAATPVAPTQDELEEKVFEKWWIGRNRPTEVNHFELANDINMNKFSAYEAVVGKFKFKRSHAGANWQITVDEKK
jgi:hypothetical protein